jgi:pimeloyl-ACP methyl ester carboxylesterase
MGRSLRGSDPFADEPFGSLRGQLIAVTTDDGIELNVECDDTPSDITMIFTHGYALTQDSWYFQRRDLRGRVRMIFWDQRSHGESQRAPGDSISLERLSRDLEQVTAATAPGEPVVLVGHSLGGMVIMDLAQRRPDLIAQQVAGVALIATSANGIDRASLGLPGPLSRAAKRVAPGLVAALASKPDLTERGRRAGGDIGYVLTRRYSFAGGGSPALVELTAAMNSATPIEVVADFLPVLSKVDTSEAYSGLARVPVLVIGAERDLLMPIAHSRDLAERFAAAGSRQVEYIEAEDTGHMVLLERPELVTNSLLDLLAVAEAELPKRRRRLARRKK